MPTTPVSCIGAFVALAVTGHALELSTLIGLLMLIDIVVTNAIVVLDLMRHRFKAGADVRAELLQGGRTHVRPILMPAAATILARWLGSADAATGRALRDARLPQSVAGGRER